MPIYTYRCAACNSDFEKRQSFSDAPLTTCEACNGALRKVIHPVGIVFKGSGWYVTDSRPVSNGSSTAKGEGSESTADSSEAKSDSKPDAKSDSKAESDSKGSAKTERKSKSEPAPKAEKPPAAATAKTEASV